MESLLHGLAHYAALGIEVIAIAIIAAGALEATIGVVAVAFRPATSNRDRREVWLNFARWLVAGLTFQLAADIVGTSFDHSWDELGRLGAIAVIRTFLSFFLDREVQDTRDLQRPRPADVGA